MFVLTLQPGEHRVPIGPTDTIDAALARAGYARSRRGCRRGGCGQCAVRLESGSTVDERPISPAVLTDERRRDGWVLPCRAMPTSDLTVSAPAVRCVSPIQRALAERRLPQPTGGS